MPTNDALSCTIPTRVGRTAGLPLLGHYPAKPLGRWSPNGFHPTHMPRVAHSPTQTKDSTPLFGLNADFGRAHA